jgi:hypothetical protein
VARRGGNLVGVPPEVIAHLEAAIEIIENLVARK